MAVIQVGSIVSDIRGSVGSETYSRGPGGLHVRARSNPSQPESEFRDGAQAIFSEVTKAWSGRLSEAQRQAWQVYGARYPRPNRWGVTSITSGYLAFVRANCTIKQAAPPVWFDVPPELGMLAAPIFTFAYSNGALPYFVYLYIDSSVDLQEGFVLIVSMGKSCNVGVTYYSTPWRFLSAHLWDGEFWDPDIISINVGTYTGDGDRLFMKGTLIDYNSGRMSIPFQTFTNRNPP